MIGRRRRTALATLSIAAVLALAACGGDADEGSAAEHASAPERGGSGFVAGEDGSRLSSGQAADPGSDADSDSGGGSGDTASGEDSPAAEEGSDSGSGSAAAERKLIRTAQIDVRVKDVPAAAMKVRALATGLGGFVSSEDSSLADRDAPLGEQKESLATIVLRIPVARFDQAISRTGELGTVTSRTAASNDVTSDIIDLDSRIATQRASVARVRVLMAQAKELKDIVLLENELSNRQADLESLEAKVAGLSDQADLSTLTVVLSQPAAQPPTTEPTPDRGFLGALGDSWSALVATGSALLVFVGLLLPWLVVIGVVGLIALAITRRQRQAEGPTGPSAEVPPAAESVAAASAAPEAETPVGAGPSSS